MLSKIIGISAVLGFLIIPIKSEAHPRHKTKHVQRSAPAIIVTIGWTWVEASLFHSAHWRHPNYGRSHRNFTSGPPPARPNQHAVWVPGHWTGKRNHRHWAPGHWSHTR
jgi:hypothetical protein